VVREAAELLPGDFRRHQAQAGIFSDTEVGFRPHEVEVCPEIAQSRLTDAATSLGIRVRQPQVVLLKCVGREIPWQRLHKDLIMNLHQGAALGPWSLQCSAALRVACVTERLGFGKAQPMSPQCDQRVSHLLVRNRLTRYVLATHPLSIVSLLDALGQ